MHFEVGVSLDQLSGLSQQVKLGPGPSEKIAWIDLGKREWRIFLP